MDRTERTAIWKGLNRMPYIGDGEMRDMKNLSSDSYPFITTRKGRRPYTFITKIPSPEGEAYRDIERLPEPCNEETGKVYKYIGNGFESGAFYKFTDGEWIKSNAYLAESVIVTSEYKTLLSEYYLDIRKNTVDEYKWYSETQIGVLAKYTGETTETYQHDAIYRYDIDVWYEWDETGAISIGNNAKIPEASPGSVGTIYTYTGETTDEFTNNKNYICRRYMQGKWEQIEGFTPVTELPKVPAEGDTMRWCGVGDLVNGNYYEISEDSGVQFYCLCDAVDAAISLSYLPTMEEGAVGTVYLYTGPNLGEFAKCYYNGNSCDWKVVEHPEVERVVTLKDYLDNYDGHGLSEILEIGSLNGNLAALIRDKSEGIKLYYNQKLYDKINNVSTESGRRLVTVGNRLVVGESGSYLYENDGEITFFAQEGSFSIKVRAQNRKTSGSWDSEREEYPSSAYGNSSGTAHFELYGEIYKEGEPDPNAIYEQLAKALSVPGTGFVVSGQRERNRTKQYLKVTSVTYKKDYLAKAYYGHPSELMSQLIIKAEGVKESFDWNIEDRYDYLTFESTDPHYHDIAAWKKRLWGYRKNVMMGTAADIFNEQGIVDWNTGDNTYTEAISQPLWQGGDITGIAALMNGLVYFKEDCITIVTGNYPAVMSSNTIPCRGLPPENRRSVAVANECVYYLSTDGVYRFDGNIPRCISRDVKISGTDAVGASDGNKYWLSLKEDSGEYALYVYDINYGIWHKEDATQAASFVMLGGEMYMAVGTEIYNLNAPQEDVSWECELWYDEGTHRRKKYKEIIVRGKVGECELYLKPDDGEWKLIGAVEDKMRMKFIPFDCEELRLKLRGKGICEIKSIDRTFEVV